KPNSRLKLAVLVLISAILACNVPGAAQPISVNDQAATVIAMTLQAQPQIIGGTPIIETSAVTPTITALSTTTTISAATITITPTYSTPMLTVIEQTNCREGPGQDYQILFSY